MRKPKNTRQARYLIRKYRNITEKEVNKVIKEHGNELKISSHTYFTNLLYYITGFSNVYDCTLCKAINMNCNYCIYKEGYQNCMRRGSEHKKTYDDICNAMTFKQVKKACNARANHIEKILKDNNW